ncbi:MAG: NAD(P)/FAD-dependent oxidoreductase, partial [Bacteroidota bacterium]
LPNRLWQNLAQAAGIDDKQRWADTNKKTLNRLAVQLTQCVFSVNGKSTFKEEFVTAGGVLLKEVNFKTFESKLLSGLYFAGEILNIDAVTGGFNFQAAWTGGYIAGTAMAAAESRIIPAL